jgi:putative polymerase
MAALMGAVPPSPVDAHAPVSLEERSGRAVRSLYLLAMIAVLGGLINNAFLCFVNTRVMAVHDGYVMIGELICIGCALIVAMDRKIGLYLGFSVFLAYMLLLFALRHQFDPKPIRDILIPFAFYFAGARLGSMRLADTIVTTSVVIVVVMGLFEYFAVETYLNFFNVLGYYLSRGAIRVQEAYGQTRGLFISGVRPEPRTILSFLGQHRVSSVFLEPVSAGNFGVIIYAWTLYRSGMRLRWLTMAGGLSVIVMADARFGLYTCILMTVMRPFFQIIPRTVWLVLPFFALAVFAIYGLSTGTHGGPNDISGRFQVTAFLLTQLSASVVFGAEVTDQFTADSGFAYTLTQFGIFGFLGLWALFVYAPAKTTKAWNFHCMAIIYFLLLMIISNSGYSLKTAGLLWFMLGSANGFSPKGDEEAQSPAQDLSLSPEPRSALS